MPADQDLKDSAEEWKRKGNDCFQRSDVEGAIQAYSQGLVQIDRAVATPHLLKAALLSNRAMCYLKAVKLTECQEDCTTALSLLDVENDNNLRSKILFRRAKSLFLQANMPHKRKEEDLQLAAKDCLSLLAFDPGNKEATQLLNTVRAQHLSDTKHSHNTPLSRTLDAIKKKDDKILHNVKVLLGLLNDDTQGGSTELGRLGGVQVLLDISNDPSVDLKARYISLQCLSCAGSHPVFCRSFLMEDIQETLSGMIIGSCSKPEEVDLVVGSMAIYSRVILHWDRDEEPDGEITGQTKLHYASLVDALCAAYASKNLTLVRAANDILSSWMAGAQRENIIRASLDKYVDLPIPKTKRELDQLSPQVLSAYKQRSYQKKTRDQAWAFERAMIFIKTGGMEKMLQCTVAADDAILRREMTVAMGKIFAALEAEAKMREAVRPLLGLSEKSTDDDEKKPENLGVVIEEIKEDDDEEGKVVDGDENDPVPAPVTFEKMMERAALATALLLANGTVGGWAMGTNGWPECREHLKSLAGSDQKTALCLVAELLAAAASVKETRPSVGGYLVEPEIKGLVSHLDRDVRTAAASAVAKLGLAAEETEDIELFGLLEAACYMLEEGEMDSGKASLHQNVTAVDTGALSSIDRGVEVLTYLVSKTLVKEELAHGFKATKESKYSCLELMVKVADRPHAGEALSAFGLASAFQMMAATPLQLRKEAFEGKQVTMEQYDELKKMQKTSEEKEFDDEPELKEDSPEQCGVRIGKMAAANVPRALCQLADGASDQTLEQVVLGLNRLANEPSVRGTMIQQGVLSKMIQIDKEEKNPSDLRKKIILNMRHCMGKMLVTMNPSLLTSAQRMGVIKPLIQLVREVGSSDLQQFEALMALTNIASFGDDTKNKIVAERGLAAFKFAMFSQHEMVKQAATEALVNMVGNFEFMKQLQEEEELRLWLALASDFEDNFGCARAAAGCLAMATGYPDVARTLIKLPTFKKRMDETLESASLEIMHRMLVVILNLAEMGGEFREAAEENGLIAFADAYVESYHDGSKAKEIEFGPSEMATFNATVDVAKRIVRACT